MLSIYVTPGDMSNLSPNLFIEKTYTIHYKINLSIHYKKTMFTKHQSAKKYSISQALFRAQMVLGICFRGNCFRAQHQIFRAHSRAQKKWSTSSEHHQVLGIFPSTSGCSKGFKSAMIYAEHIYRCSKFCHFFTFHYFLYFFIISILF